MYLPGEKSRYNQVHYSIPVSLYNVGTGKPESKQRMWKNGEACTVGVSARASCIVHAECSEAVATAGLRSEFCIHEGRPGLLRKGGKYRFIPIITSYIRKSVYYSQAMHMAIHNAKRLLVEFPPIPQNAWCDHAAAHLTALDTDLRANEKTRREECFSVACPFLFRWKPHLYIIPGISTVSHLSWASVLSPINEAAQMVR